MRKWLIAAVATVWSTAALAQGTVLQSGPMTPGHPSVFKQNGVIKDPGPAGNGAAGLGITELLQVNPPTPPGTGPSHAHSCFWSAPITSPTNYLCLDANQSGSTVISTGAIGGASALPLVLSINGANYNPIGPGAGNIVGPGSTTMNGFVCWNSTLGVLVKDCATQPVLGPATTVSGDVACWNNTTGTLLKDCQVLPLVPVAAPGNPASGWVLYDDTATGIVNLKNNTGVTVPLSTPTGPLFTNIVQLTSGSGNWTVPAGVYWVYVQEWGGGGGSGGTSGGDPVPGAGSGAYTDIIMAVTPGTLVPYFVGAGGGPGAADGTGVTGGTTTWNTTVIAHGGVGSSISAVGGGGTSSGGQISLMGRSGAVQITVAKTGGNGGPAPRGSGGGLGALGACSGGNQPGGGAGGPGNNAGAQAGCSGGDGLIYLRF